MAIVLFRNRRHRAEQPHEHRILQQRAADLFGELVTLLHRIGFQRGHGAGADMQRKCDFERRNATGAGNGLAVS